MLTITLYTMCRHFIRVIDASIVTCRWYISKIDSWRPITKMSEKCSLKILMYVSNLACNLKKYVLTDSCACISTHMTSTFIHLNIKLNLFFHVVLGIWLSELNVLFYICFRSEHFGYRQILVTNEDRTSGSFDLIDSFCKF